MTTPAVEALVLIVLALVQVTGTQTPPSGDITVVITGLRSTEGKVLISLYDKAEGFPKDRSAVIQAVAIEPERSGQITTAFESLPYGDYALAVLHDEDVNGDMTFGAFHLPKEGYCFSNNVKVRFKAPKFKKTSFTLNGNNVTQTLRMVY